EWLLFCEDHHSRMCKTLLFPQLPSFQVIDCQSRTVVPWVYEDTGRVFLTLSYVWGNAYIESLGVDGALPALLPAVIEDSITVTLRLGYRFLWVDRYCIPQTDEAAKAIQIGNMNLIFEHSELTIIAASGNDPSYGLPGVNGNPRRTYPSVTIKDHTFHPFLSNAAHEITHSMWNTRGWTYQEALLSRRCLMFTDSQVFFQCRGMHCQE
ncbi:HET-domain-containing protein, partial [Lophium mytilinum]